MTKRYNSSLFPLENYRDGPDRGTSNFVHPFFVRSKSRIYRQSKKTRCSHPRTVQPAARRRAIAINNNNTAKIIVIKKKKKGDRKNSDNWNSSIVLKRKKINTSFFFPPVFITTYHCKNTTFYFYYRFVLFFFYTSENYLERPYRIRFRIATIVVISWFPKRVHASVSRKNLYFISQHSEFRWKLLPHFTSVSRYIVFVVIV